jgi:Dolichyl-phosphate-mannose-protein mannosyltransferase
LSLSVAAEGAKAAGLARSTRAERRQFLTLFILSYFALAFSLICIASFVQKSPTIDEPIHLFAGYSYLKHGDFRANPEHPPLAKIWAALPLLAFDVKDPVPESLHWRMIPDNLLPLPTLSLARQMLLVENDGETLFFYGKLQMIALSILLGVFIYVSSKSLFGFEAAVAAIFIYALDPNVLAHSQIVHTDMPFAAFFFISTYFFWRTLGRFNWRGLALTSLFFALAAITKYSFVAILPIWLILGLAKLFLTEPPQSFSGDSAAPNRRGKAFELLGVLCAAAVTAYVFTWAVYGFRFAAVPGGSTPLRIDWVMPPEKTLLRSAADYVTAHRLFPEAWIYGQLYTLKFLQRESFLLGQVSVDGFWSYFPVALAVKTPLPTLIALVIGLILLIRGRLNKMNGVLLLIPAIVYFSFAIWSRANIGFRYILPIFPFLFVFAGGAVAELWQKGGWAKRGVVVLALWSLGSCWATYPHYLAFFNELVGGPKNGYKVLLDSNLDWGQDLKGLKRWMDANGVKKIRFLYFGGIDPEYYRIQANYVFGSWMGSDGPSAGGESPNYVAMSAHLFYGRSREDSFVKPFRFRAPVATVGHSIFIFKMPESGAP